MAIAHVRDVGAVGASASGSTLVLTLAGLAAPVAIGNHLIVWAMGGGQAPTSCADSDGVNAYALDRSGANVDPRLAFLACKVAAALDNGDTITVTFAGSTASRAFRVREFSGLHDTTWADIANAGASSSGLAGTAADSGAAPSGPSNTEHLEIGAVGHVSTVGSFAFTNESSAWTHAGAIASTGTVRTLQTGYRIVTEATACRCRATWTTSRNWAGMVHPYLAAAAGGASLPHRLAMLGVG